MVLLRSLADLAVLTLPSIVPVISDDIEIGHTVAHGGAQASANDAAGKPLGFFQCRADAEAAVRRTCFQEIDH